MRPDTVADGAAVPGRKGHTGALMPNGKPAANGQSHGGFRLARLVREGRLDLRTVAAQTLRRLEADLANDLGGMEALSTQQRIMVGQVALKVLVLQRMSDFALSLGVMTRRGRLLGVLGTHYLAWSNSVRQDLGALGLERRAKDVVDLAARAAARAVRETHGDR